MGDESDCDGAFRAGEGIDREGDREREETRGELKERKEKAKKQERKGLSSLSHQSIPVPPTYSTYVHLCLTRFVSFSGFFFIDECFFCLFVGWL